MQYLNVSSYRFVHLQHPAVWEAYFRKLCTKLTIKGTILLSHEGINLALSGSQDAMDAFSDALSQHDEFRDLYLKPSWSGAIPFRRLRIRVKKEIIKMGVENIRPDLKTGTYLSPAEFKKWLDENRDVAIVDTRNDYEIKVGTFKNAINLHIENFRDFPQASKNLPGELKEKPVVMFCTGGIRCEKASALYLEYGFKYVYQIDGGIIEYFKECGGAHWDGECFVFDNRVAVRPDLTPTEKHYCLACLDVLSDEEVKSNRFLYNHYCPHCYDEQTGASYRDLRHSNVSSAL